MIALHRRWSLIVVASGAWLRMLRQPRPVPAESSAVPIRCMSPLGAWATVRGLATLWLDGALSQFTDEDLFQVALGIFEADHRV